MRRRILLGAMLLGLGGSGCDLAGEAVNPFESQEDPEGGSIAFASERDGGYDIYAMAENGDNLVRLTNHPARDTSPAWSPDGGRIIFSTNREPANPEIFAMDFTGENQFNVSRFPLGEAHPDWSPDGDRIAFDSRRDGNGEIYVMGIDGGNVQRLTRHRAEDGHPSWSPDGTQIAFESGREIYVPLDIEMDPGELEALEASAILANEAALSFNDSSFNEQIYIMDADGDNVRRLTFAPGRDREPAWSPDGSQIAFSSDRSGRFDIYVVSVDGGEPINLTQSPFVDTSPTWAPDGTKIAFVSGRVGSRDIYTMNADGKNVRNLTQNPYEDVAPAWMPEIDLDTRNRCLFCPGFGFGGF